LDLQLLLLLLDPSLRVFLSAGHIGVLGVKGSVEALLV